MDRSRKVEGLRMEWKDGYVAEIEYVRSFHRRLAPSSLNFVLMMSGFTPVPLDREFSYCDLGCGQGESLNLLSACHPEGSFHGVDFHHGHIENARSRARKGGLGNVTFWEADFADLEELPLPQFDFIVMHGVYSWVNAEKRQDILNFLRLKLKPGGVVYNGYNALPGWAAHAPLRQLLLSYADTQSGRLEERIEGSLDFVRHLKGLNVGYFNSYPLSSELFDALGSLPRSYVAHEFFNRNWTPFYHADVVDDFAGADLTFACSARFAEFKDSLRFPADVVRFLGTISDPVMRETVKDFAANQQFRSDVFTKGRSRLSGSQQMEQLLSYRFALVVPRDTAALEVALPGGMKELAPELYDPILSALEEQSLSLEEIYRRVMGAGFATAEVLEALIVLCAVEYIMPVVDSSPEAIATTRSYNVSILEEATVVHERRFLASPLLRSGLPVSWPHLLLLLCEVSKEEDPSAFVWKHMLDDLTERGVPHESEQSRTELRLILENFATVLPIIKKLGAV